MTRAFTTAKKTLTHCVGALSLGVLLLGSPAQAQNLFAPIAKVNDRVITAYELSQRAAYLTLLRAPGDPQILAREQLTNEALQRGIAKQLGVTISDEELQTGMEEFTARFNLTVEKFQVAIAQGGVAIETFRDFVAAGLIWRNVVRERFRGRINITEEDVDRRLAQTGSSSAVRVLLSEIILPANTPQAQAASSARSTEIAQITTLPAFAAAARRYSASPSKGRSGRLDWMDLSNLPPAIAAQIIALAPGEVTDPLPVNGGIAFFQMRALEEFEGPAPENVSVDYATYLIPGGKTPETLGKAATIRAKIDTCDDLYAVAQGQPVEQLVRENRPVGELPNDYAIELAKMDPGESSTALVSPSGQNLVFLMLCARSSELPEEVSRDQIKAQLQNQRLQSYAKSYLEELRAAAFIEEYTQQ